MSRLESRRHPPVDQLGHGRDRRHFKLYTLWFPPPYFRAAGAGTLIPRLMGFDITIDPLPEFYVPYEQVAADLIKHAQPPPQRQPADAGQRKQLAWRAQAAAPR